jgi:predicted acyltransferase
MRTRLLSIDYFRGSAVVLMLVYDYVLFFSRSIPLVFQHDQFDKLSVGDFVAPLFLFIMGLSLAFSIDKRRSLGDAESTVFWQVVRRSVLLVLIGVLVDDLRTPLLGGTIGLGGTYYIKWGVLETLGVSYIVAYLIMRVGTKARFALIAFLLAVYAVLISNPSVAAFVQTHAHGSPVASISWATIAVFGMIAGERLIQNRQDYELFLYRMGGTLIIIGAAVSLFIPPWKELVSPSYALITAGASAIAYMTAYYVMETRKLELVVKWLKPLNDFGRAALAAWILQYVLAGYLIWYFHFHNRLDPLFGVPLAFAMVAVVWIVLRLFDRVGLRFAI